MKKFIALLALVLVSASTMMYACLLIGDSPSSDIRGANNAGIPCCWYDPHGTALPEDLRIDYRITDLRQLYDIV